MAHEETLAVRMQLIALCNEQTCVSDIQTFEVSDMWTCDQENFTLDCEGKDRNQMCIYIYIFVCLWMCFYVCVYIYIYVCFLWPCRVWKMPLNALAFLKFMVHFCCYVRDKFSTNYIPIKRKIKSVNQDIYCK